MSGPTTMIALAGKGGVGKTTCSALILRALASSGIRPALAVDADPNDNLHLLLGMPRPKALGSLREELLSAGAGTAPKNEVLDALLQRRVEEGRDVDLVTMGRGEGPGCYCYVNNLLRQSLSRLAGNYRAVVVDNEAGMEHLSRRNLSRIDHLMIVSDPSPRGLAAARTIADLAARLGLPVGRTWLLLNRAYGAGFHGAPRAAGGPIEGREAGGIPLLAEIPHDPSLPEWEASGRSFLEMPGASAAAAAVENAISALLAGRVR